MLAPLVVAAVVSIGFTLAPPTPARNMQAENALQIDSVVLADEKCRWGWPYCLFAQSIETSRTVRTIPIDRLQ
jgi:hypothetical protein